jgi:hypothetical protein
MIPCLAVTSSSPAEAEMKLEKMVRESLGNKVSLHLVQAVPNR